MTALDMPTRIGDLLDDATAHIVVIEEDVECEWDQGKPSACRKPADWDVFTACAAGCEDTAHVCDRHLKTVRGAIAVGAAYCPTHGRSTTVRIVATYPRRNA